MARAKHYALATICGVMATLTLAPFHWVFLLIPAFSGLFLLLWKSEATRQCFWTGWWFGLGYFASGLYWFAHALLVEPEKFAWMIPFAVFGLPSVLAIYYGICSAIWHRIRHSASLSALPAILCFTLLWGVVEWLRGQLFTGFPWNLIAYSWAFSEPMLQWSWLIGAYGYVIWTVLLATLPAIWLLSEHGRQRILALSLTLLMVSVPFTYGSLRLNANPTQVSEQTVHVVQGNIAQQHKWQPDKQYEAVKKYVELSQQDGLPDSSLIIWPETAYPYFLEANTPPVKFIADALPQKGRLITGAMRAQWHEDKKGIKDFYNSVHVVRPDASVEAVYDKVKLVPFGEFVPLRGVLPVEKITHGLQDFTRGSGADTLSLEGFPAFQPLICYEVIYPDFVAKTEGEAPQWLLNITNDAWFGHSSGPYQHLAMTRFRAVERGLPMVRAANTGISAVYDAYGRELGRVPLDETGVITVKLPQPAE